MRELERIRRYEVSIPHRYDPNSAYVDGMAIAVKMFQFLIGTIQTTRRVGHGGVTTGFQFLIGTIQTYELSVRYNQR